MGVNINVSYVLSIGSTGSCIVFACSASTWLKSVDEGTPGPRIITVFSDTSFSGLTGSTTESWVDEVSEPL